MNLTPIVIWAVSLMTWKASPERLANQVSFPGNEETVEEKSSRYQQIAQAAADVAFDPNEHPVFLGSNARYRTLAALLAISFHESGYAKDVDIGPCYRGKDGKSERCDHGQSACLMQIKIGAGTTDEGWSQAELFSDRRKCFRAGLHLLQKSVKTCLKHGADFAFDGYAGGTCETPASHKSGLQLLELSRDFYKHNQLTLTASR